MKGRASSLTPERRHGSDEPGSTRRDRERDRDRRSAESTPQKAGTTGGLVGDPVAQASAYKMMPAGPQDEEDLKNAYESVLNRLQTIENNLRKRAQAISDHEEKTAANTTRCEWLFNHINNVDKDVKDLVSPIGEKVNAHGLQRQEVVNKIEKRWIRKSTL